MKKTRLNVRSRYIVCFMAMLLFLLAWSVPAIAATEMVFTTNSGSYAHSMRFSPGSTVVIYGNITNSGFGVPNASVVIEAEIEDVSIFYTAPRTDANGYFRAVFNIPTSALPGDEVTLHINGVERKFVLLSVAELMASGGQNNQGPLQVIGFIKGTEGSVGTPSMITISEAETKLGIIFNRNVNFFRDGQNPDGLEDLGSIERNTDCFTLYENGVVVPVRVNLVENPAGEVSIDINTEATILAGATLPNNPGRQRNIIFVEPVNGLKVDAEYKLVISGQLVNNGGVSLGDDVTIYYTTFLNPLPPNPTTYIVTFVNWDGTVLKTQTVEQGSAATPPAVPSRSGHTFTGWDREFNNVTANLTVTAQWSLGQIGPPTSSYTVTFVNWDGTVLKTQTVEQGFGATAPAAPSRSGYTFSGWDKTFNNITANLTVTAQWMAVITPPPTPVIQPPVVQPPVIGVMRVRLTVGETAYTANGVAKKMDVAPEIVKDRTMVPLRFVAEALGAKVDWDGANMTAIVELDGVTLKVKIGELAPGMDVPAVLINDRTVVPLRYISEMLGCQVDWNQDTQTIDITK